MINPVKKFAAAAVLIITAAGFVSPQVLFEYKYIAGEKWHLNVNVDQEILINGKHEARTDILNKISVVILSADGISGLLSCSYKIAQKDLESDLYNWSEEYSVEYYRDKMGYVSGIDKSSPVPSVRNVPVFPDYKVSPGDEWIRTGTEVYDLGNAFGLNKLLNVEFPVDYRYSGREIVDGSEYYKIEISYGYEWNNENDFKDQEWYPVKISGNFNQKILWDNNTGRNYSVEDVYSYTFFMNDGNTFTFRGTSEGKAVYSKPLDKQKLLDKINDRSNEGMSAVVTEDGVSITLDNIRFKPDKAEMLSGENKKLEKIAHILSEYRDRDIIIVGHTAKVPGKSDGMMLSEQRAAAVAGYLVDTGAVNAKSLIIKGVGNSEPVGDDSTEQGRRLNRRVEIIIMEN
jgi:outer membrane protein OmpA-like peptidoglycan-associated protein